MSSFNLLIYGRPLISLIIKQLTKQNRDSYWNVFAEIMDSLPYRLAIQILNDSDTMNVLRHSKPEILFAICLRIVRGASV